MKKKQPVDLVVFREAVLKFLTASETNEALLMVVPAPKDSFGWKGKK